jgi:pimeloyl-ACP methyl ester carboxylesterase
VEDRGMSGESSFIEVPGANVEVVRRGSGKPLLYLHSAGGNVWGTFLERVSERFTVIAPTHPGFGRSTGLEKIDTIHDLVFHLVDVLDALGLERLPVVGLSLGGWIAAELAVLHSERVEKLVLLDPVGLRVEGAPVAEFFLAGPAESRRLLFHDPESEIARTFVPDEPSPELLAEVLKAREATARVGWNPYMHDPRLAERLYRVKAPTLVVWGDDDKLVPLAHGENWVKGIRGAKLVTIPQCGHAPPFEKPEETARTVLDFLTR